MADAMLAELKLPPALDPSLNAFKGVEEYLSDDDEGEDDGGKGHDKGYASGYGDDKGSNKGSGGDSGMGYDGGNDKGSNKGSDGGDGMDENGVSQGVGAAVFEQRGVDAVDVSSVTSATAKSDDSESD